MHGRSVPTSCTCCGHIAVRAAAVGCAVGSCRKRPFVANVSCLVVGAVMVNETEGVVAAGGGSSRRTTGKRARDPELLPTRETVFTEVTDTAAAIDQSETVGVGRKCTWCQKWHRQFSFWLVFTADNARGTARQIGDSYTDTDTRFVGGYTATIGWRTPDPGALTVWRVASQIGRQLETQSPQTRSYKSTHHSPETLDGKPSGVLVIFSSVQSTHRPPKSVLGVQSPLQQLGEELSAAHEPMVLALVRVRVR
eukprot:scaffold79875_cov63-Phaeocystis_antarctica.AAC.1